MKWLELTCWELAAIIGAIALLAAYGLYEHIRSAWVKRKNRGKGPPCS